MVEHLDRGHLRLVAPQLQPIARPHGAGAHAHVGDLLAARAALDLEHGAGDVAVGRALHGRQQLGHPGGQRVHAGTGARRPEEHGMHERPPRLRGEPRPQPGVRDRRLVLDVRGQECVVVVGEPVDQRTGEARVGRAVRHERRVPGAQPAGGSHRDDRRRQLLLDPAQHGAGARAAAVDLVDEDQRRHAQAPQRAHQHAGLRLHALDGGDDEHRAVEHAQHAFHLGDEVRVSGRVDQVDGDVADRERDDRGLDRDAALAFQRERVRLRAACVDAADLVDDPGGVQQPLGQAGLTGVDVRQNS